MRFIHLFMPRAADAGSNTWGCFAAAQALSTQCSSLRMDAIAVPAENLRLAELQRLGWATVCAPRAVG